MNRILKKLLGFSIGILCFSSLNAQFEEYVFHSLPPEIRLSQGSIIKILQDQKGFLWMATWSGLVRYDGYSVKVYTQKPGNTNGLKSNKITALFEDSKGRLWIGTTYTGFYRYDRKKDQFVQYSKDPTDPNSLSNDNVESIIEDNDGFIWIGTEKGLNRFDPDKNTFQHFYHDPKDSYSLSHDFVYTMAVAKDGSFWVGAEEGLNRVVKNGNKYHFMRYDLSVEGMKLEDHESHNFIYRIVPSRFHANTLWITSSIGLKKIDYHPTTFQIKKLRFYQHLPGEPGSLSNRFVSDVFEESASRIWVATYNGLNLMDQSSGQFRHFFSDRGQPNSLSNNTLHCLYFDHSGILWIGTSKGVNKLHLKAKPFHSRHPGGKNNPNSDIVTCITPAADGEGLWMGSKGGGISYMSLNQSRSSQNVFKNYQLRPSRVTDLAAFVSDIILDKRGYLWISTHGAGILRIKEKDIPTESGVLRNVDQFSEGNQLIESYIITLLESQRGDIWFGYWDQGLGRYDHAKDKFFSYQYSRGLEINFCSFPVVHLFETLEKGKAYLWVGTRGAGVYKLHFNEGSDKLEWVKHFQSDGNAGSLSSNFINCFYLENNHSLWIGTENGLNKITLKDERVDWYQENDGLANSIIQSITGDSKGNIWVSTLSGLSSLSFQNGHTTVKNYDAFDGLQDNYFNDDVATVTKYGHLVFGGINGLNIFKPEEIKPDLIPPKVAITGFRLFNKDVPIGKMEDGRTLLPESISELKEICLAHRDNVIAFDFVGMQFTEPQKITYAYKLEGFDGDWVYTSASQRSAHYTNLPFDDYVFMVKAANSDGVWSEPVSIKLGIMPPFWLTGWAFSLYLLLFLGLIYGVWKITHMRAELRSVLAMERLEHEKSEEVNQLKLQFFTNISHELRTPLTLILSPLEQLIQSREGDKKQHYLFTRMHFNANRLLNMINQLLDIRKSEAGLLKLKVAEEDIVQFAREVTISFKIFARQRNIQLRFFSDCDELKVWFDRDQFEKVLYNLLSNAFKFTPDEGQISVKVWHEPDNELCHIEVKDNGIGIPEEQLSNIFERFYQVEKSQEWARKGGTGIGLTLTKNIMEQHQGTVKVRSKLNEGSVFTVSLRLGENHFTEDQKTKDEILIRPLAHFIAEEEDSYISTPEKTNGHQLSDGIEDSTTQTDKPIVLIVEDNLDIRAYLRENMDKDYQILEANDGLEGLDTAIANPPDLILADVAMPRMDGIEMCRKLKNHVATSHIPVVLLTARTSLIFKIDGFESGADEYITKPFNLRLLETRIRNLLDTRKKLREKYAHVLDLNPSEVIMHSIDEGFINNIKSVVEKNMANSNFSVDCLANEVCMSRMQLYRKLKSLFNKSPNEVIRIIRLKRAAQLLEVGQFNVSEVTYMVGYNDLKSFREQFKKEFGMNPSAYERSN